MTAHSLSLSPTMQWNKLIGGGENHTWPSIWAICNQGPVETVQTWLNLLVKVLYPLTLMFGISILLEKFLRISLYLADDAIAKLYMT